VDKTVLIYFKEYQMTRILLFMSILTTSISGHIKLKDNSGHGQSTFRNGQCYGGQSIKAMDAHAILPIGKYSLNLKPTHLCY
jgi:hypothetical protein